MATATGTWSSVGSTDDDCYCTDACSFTYEMCDLAVESISNDELGFSDSDIDDMYDDCDAVHDGCLDECNGESGYDAFSSRSSEAFSSRSTKTKQRNHHYTFDIDHNGLDINGFVLHTNKNEGKRHKLRLYLDSNENGRFDKNDLLIGRTGISNKLAAKSVGNLIKEDEVGQVEVKFKRFKSNASMKRIDDSNFASDNIVVDKHDDFLVKSMLFESDSIDNSKKSIIWTPPKPVFVDFDAITKVDQDQNSKSDQNSKIDLEKLNEDLENAATLNSSVINDPEFHELWVENCTGDAKPPYPEDCFFMDPLS